MLCISKQTQALKLARVLSIANSTVCKNIFFSILYLKWSRLVSCHSSFFVQGNLCALSLSLGNLGSGNKSLTIQIPSHPNLDGDLRTFWILRSNLYRQFQIRFIFDLFLISFQLKSNKFNLFSNSKRIKRSKSQLKDQKDDFYIQLNDQKC